MDWYSFGCGLALTYAWITLAYGEHLENLTCVVIE